MKRVNSSRVNEANLLESLADQVAGVTSAAGFVLNGLWEEHGPSMPMPDLLQMLTDDCPRHSATSVAARCGAHFPGLPALFIPEPDGGGNQTRRMLEGMADWFQLRAAMSTRKSQGSDGVSFEGGRGRQVALSEERRLCSASIPGK